MKTKTTLSLTVTILIIASILSILLITTYNGIVIAEKGAEEYQAHVEAACQRRLDLIPNLVETVKAYAAHEKDTLIAVTQARSNAQGTLENLSKKKSLSKEDMKIMAVSQTKLMGSLSRLLVVIEKYPEIKANENFMAMQDQLEGTENRINIARQRYNRTAKIYNTKIATFPGIVIAPLFGFEEKGYFESREKALESVKVAF